jgi:hypothetical protein
LVDTGDESFFAKGTFFITARRYLEQHDPECLPPLRKYLDPEWAHLLDDALATEWYPEAQLGCLLRGLRAELAPADPEAYIAHLDAINRLGINSFFSMLLRLTSPRFALNRSPRIAQLLHRGPFTSHVLHEEAGTLVVVDGFTQLRDRNYREQLASGLRVLVCLTGHECHSHVEHWDENTFRVRVTWT